MPPAKLSISDKLLSVEVIASALFTAFLISGSWFSLSYATETNTTSIDELKASQESTVKDLSKIKTDVAVLLDRQTTQSQFSERRLNSINESLNDVRGLIQRLHISENGR